MLNDEGQILGEAIRRARIEVSRLESQLANAHRAREIAASPFIGAAEVDQESLPSDESIARIEAQLEDARAYLAELQAADDEQVREQVAQADAARAAHAAEVEQARVEVVRARKAHDAAIAARLAAAQLDDLAAYEAAAEASDTAHAALERARRRHRDLSDREVA